MINNNTTAAWLNLMWGLNMSNPCAQAYLDFDDFTLWVLRVERVRWVGGYARMDSVDGTHYALAEPDPVAPAAAHAPACSRPGVRGSRRSGCGTTNCSPKALAKKSAAHCR